MTGEAFFEGRTAVDEPADVYDEYAQLMQD